MSVFDTHPRQPDYGPVIKLPAAYTDDMARRVYCDRCGSFLGYDQGRRCESFGCDSDWRDEVLTDQRRDGL